MFDFICAEGLSRAHSSSPWLLPSCSKSSFWLHTSGWNCWLWVCGARNLLLKGFWIFPEWRPPAWLWLPDQAMLVLTYDSLFKAIKINVVVKFFIAATSLKSSSTTLVFGISQIGEKGKEITRAFCSGLCCSFHLPASAWWSLYFFNVGIFSMASEKYCNICKKIFTFSSEWNWFCQLFNSLVFVRIQDCWCCFGFWDMACL